MYNSCHGLRVDRDGYRYKLEQVYPAAACLKRGPLVANRMARNVASRFDEEIRFFKTWMDKPKAMGAVLPTSNVTARRMASLINPGCGDPVLELGPGTGVITKAILACGVRPAQLYSIEYTEAFIPQLKSDFPGVNVIHGNAFELDDVLPDMGDGRFDTIISAIPLLNFAVKQRVELLNELFDRLNPGRPIVQISYGPVSPIPPDWRTYSVEPFDWMVRNIPPARLWVFRRILAA